MNAIKAAPFNACTSPVKDGEFYKLTILHTNDIHGHLDKLSLYSTIIKEVRARTDNVLVLDGGDLFMRGEFEHLQGEVETKLLNAMGYDAWVPGNNDFRVPQNGGTTEEGNSQLRRITDSADFKAVCANVIMKDSKAYINGMEPYVIKELNGVKIGIIGVTSLKPQNRNWPEVSDKIFESGDTAVSKIIDEVKEKTDITIVLSHTGFATDLKTAQIAGVSAVLGADDHYRILEPVFIKNSRMEITPITQNGGEDNNCLGRLDLLFKIMNGIMTLEKYNGFFYDLSYAKGDDDIQNIIDSYRKNSDKAVTAA